MVAILGLSGRIFKNAAKTRETVLFQLVGTQGLSIADSSFLRLASPVPPAFSKNSKKETGAEVKNRPRSESRALLSRFAAAFCPTLQASLEFGFAFSHMMSHTYL